MLMNRKITRRTMLTVAGSATLAAVVFRVRPGAAEPPTKRPRSSYRDRVLEKGPVAYWRLGEREGPTAADELGAHHGKYHGAPAFHETGAIKHDGNTAIGLDGRSYVEISDSSRFSQPTSGAGLTVEVWLRPDQLVFRGQSAEHYVHWLGKGEAGRHEWAFRFYSRDSSRPNRISAYLWSPSGGEGAGAYFQEELQARHWIHVVACYQPGDLRRRGAGVQIYRDGVLRLGPPARGTLYSNALFNVEPAHGAAPLRLGTRDLKSFLIGGLDEVAIYPRVLTAAEVLDNYRAAAG
jgi:hypothetical protein